MNHHRELLKVIDNIYSQGMQPNGLPGLLKYIADFLGGDNGAALSLIDLNNNDWNFVESIGGQSVKEYLRQQAPEDPRALYHLTHTWEKVQYDYKFIDEPGISRSAYYDWVTQNTGSKYYMGICTEIQPGFMAGLIIPYTVQQGHVSDKQIEMATILESHLQRALQLNQTLNRANQQQVIDAQFERYSPVVRICISHKGRVINFNSMADRLLTKGSPLVIKNNQLTAIDPLSNRLLQNSIFSSMQYHQGDVQCSGDNIQILDPVSGLSLAAVVYPLPSSGRLLDPEGAAAVILIGTREGEVGIDEIALARFFNLTKMEAKLLHLMAQGKSLYQCAEILGMAKNTARAHRQRIFNKTSTHSQGELIRLVFTSPFY